MVTRDRIGAAFHEAGHAVTAWSLGVQVCKIVAGVGDDDLKGHSHIGDESHLDLIDRIAIALAGVEAQSMFNACTHDLAGVQDFAMVADVINEDEISEAESRELHQRGFARAREILSRNAGRVTRLATRLATSGVVSEEEFLQVMKALEPPDCAAGRGCEAASWYLLGLKAFTEAGGLMSHGPNLPDLFRRAADITDKILHGTKLGDIPVEQPTKFDLVINLTTAKALGLTIPPTLLALADEVIEWEFFAALHESAHGTTRKRLAARIDSANWGEADSNAAVR
jgi:hypothetical protein